MQWIGLTGGIASGKSTCTTYLVRQGVRVIDADIVAREVVSIGSPALSKIRAHFGDAILRDDGTLNRSALAQRIFSNTMEKQALEAIILPAIQVRTRTLREEAQAAGEPFAVYDAALIVEKSLYLEMDGLIVVSIPPELQIARVMTRDGLSREEAQARLRAQLPLSEKRRVATWIVDNSGTTAQTHRQLDSILEALKTAATSPRT